MNKLTHLFIFSLFLVCLNASSLPGRTAYSGMRLVINDNFMKSTSQVVLEKIFKSLPALLEKTQGNFLNFGVWPLIFNLTILDLNTTNYTMEAEHASIKPGPQNGSFILKTRKT